jgi:tocopherol O-methyltransferase
MQRAGHLFGEAKRMLFNKESLPVFMTNPINVDIVRDHYDRISVFYRALWGEHIHHGYWEGGESSAEAQVKLIERLASRVRIDRCSRVLDIGCGVGGSSLWLARYLGCRVLGISISPVQVEMAMERARSEGLDSFTQFKVMDANHLDLTDGSFDVVWVIECSEHLKDKRQFISDCARILKPGGSLALCAWLVSDNIESDEHSRLIGDVCRGMLLPSLASMRNYTAWMSESGFDDIEAEDITRRVERTWKRCIKLVERPEIKLLLRASDARTRDFVEAFRAIGRAYAENAMAYGMFTAIKSE